MPVTPGSDGIVENEKDALVIARKIGYPVMIKATAGGGGRGMRPAHNDGSLVAGFRAASTEAEKAFGNGSVYIEKLIENPHHIEFQIMADMHGNVVHLGERDCSMQRRNQKIIEETASPIMTAEIRQRMGDDCVRLAKEVGYVGAGTIECLMNDSGDYYFMEMNTRIQVEHCITEEAYGVDLVKEQIKVAFGEKLSHWMHNAKPKYHAIECRVNAEDPFNNFQPSPGKIDLYYAPGGRGVRIDSHAYTGYVVPPYYDSMIAKVIAVGTTRENAIFRMRRALGEYIIRGVKTTIPFQQRIMHDPDFVRGKYHTGFVAKMLEAGIEYKK